ncbi:hypothetical protein ACHAXA_007520 [Cyclostephanos tholiformis]|uniref:Cupin 2 conserved barrel domain-containing protein n=1 Tax=Cyclostephanos tholiformis TaxID=382380 RepID=A0ABD3RCT8_9STRA
MEENVACPAYFEPPPRERDDGRVVGTDEIFSSPNVTPPSNGDGEGGTKPTSPPLDDGIPAPSVYYDDRGEIHNVIANGGYRMNILYTRAGCLRSGDIHPNEQCDFVFSGKVRVWTLAEDGSTTIATHGRRSFICIPRGMPHVFEFVEDTVMAEWWEPQGFQAWFYKPYRDIVSRSITRGGCGGGGGGEGRRKGLVILIPRTNFTGIAGTLILAAAIGIAGFALGSKFGGRR